MVNSVADFGSPVWLKSIHINMIDVQLNEAMRKVSGSVRATLVAWLSVLCNIILPEQRRKKALSNLLFKSEHHENSILFDIIQEKTNQRLKSKECQWKIFNDVKSLNINKNWKKL